MNDENFQSIVRQRFLPSSFSPFTFQLSQLFYGTQIPVCLGFETKRNALEMSDYSRLFASETKLSLLE